MGNQMVKRFRRSGTGKAVGLDCLVLTTVGAKTGQKRQTLLAWFPDSDNAWLIVASAGGMAANPAWYHNLAAAPRYANYEKKTDRLMPVIRLTQPSRPVS